ncbi:MAG: hypothetical protein V2I33_18165 [Kangiellaceae bacterium]|jgi:hypothetical protein|nr:hypothetical protein [Kangiellaceae bacterium]
MNQKEERKPNIRNYRIFSSNWFITLSATLVGVFTALYLNEFVATQKINDARANATEKILTELDSNLSSMRYAIQVHQQVYDVLDFMKYRDSESGKLTVPLEIKKRFCKDYPNLLSVKDSVLVAKGVYEYSNGGLDFDFRLPQFELSTIGWNTLLNTGISRSYSFECLLHLQVTYKLTERIILINEELFNTFYRTQNLEADREKILRLLAMLLDHEQTAIQELESGKEKIKNCR